MEIIYENSRCAERVEEVGICESVGEVRRSRESIVGSGEWGVGKSGRPEDRKRIQVGQLGSRVVG